MDQECSKVGTTFGQFKPNTMHNIMKEMFHKQDKKEGQCKHFSPLANPEMVALSEHSIV